MIIRYTWTLKVLEAPNKREPFYAACSLSLGLQIVQSRYYLQTLDPKVGTICILGALGFVSMQTGRLGSGSKLQRDFERQG